MTEPVSLINLQFLAWVGDRPRTHADVMEAWRTSCPRLSAWEDCIIAGLVRIENGTKAVSLTPLGRETLARENQAQAPPAA